MKETIKTMIVFFSFLVPLFGQGGENYRAFNRLIRQTDIENFYTVNELRALFEDPMLQESKIILDRFKRKPEKNKTYQEYRNIFLQEERIQKGVAFCFEHKETLKKISEDFDIDPLIIVAIIGIETNYGTRFAEHSVLVLSLIHKPPNFHKGELGQQRKCLSFLFIVKKKG